MIKPYSLVATADTQGVICESCGKHRAALYVIFPPCEPADAFAVCSGCGEVAP